MDSLHRTALPEYFRKPASEFRIEKYYLDLLNDPKTILLRAFDKSNALTGLVHAALKEQPTTVLHVPGTYVLLDNLVIGKRYRRKGIGKRLFQGVSQWAKESKANEIQLKVYAFNINAMEFYRGLGFSEFNIAMRRTC